MRATVERFHLEPEDMSPVQLVAEVRRLRAQVEGRTLEERADVAGEDDTPRLRGKESGVRLALSYMDDYRDEVSR